MIIHYDDSVEVNKYDLCRNVFTHAIQINDNDAYTTPTFCCEG